MPSLIRPRSLSASFLLLPLLVVGAEAARAERAIGVHVATSLSGTYLVGAGRPYPTLSAAVTDLNAAGAAGPVVFELTDASYTTGTGESFPIVVNAFAGASAVNTLT